MKDIPVYRFPAEHARENGELELYRASNKANAACKEAIEKAISEHYCDNVLHREAVAQVAEQFGHERILYVLAITIRQKDWDGRFSADNKQWAKTVPVAENPDAWGTDRNCYLAVNSHSGLVDRQIAVPIRPPCVGVLHNGNGLCPLFVVRREPPIPILLPDGNRQHI